MATIGARRFLAAYFSSLPAIFAFPAAYGWLCGKDGEILELRYLELEPK
jgi:hypothetical protein